jgi:hypothetical protein
MFSNHPVHTKINFHFKHITSTIPKHIQEIHEVKKEQERKLTLPIKNHVLYEFCPSVSDKKPKENTDIDNVSGLVEYVVDHIDIGDVYHSNEENLHYNPMNFSVRHYISSK